MPAKSSPMILSVPQLMKNGIRMLINDVGVPAFTQQSQTQVATSFADLKMPLSAIRVNVSSADRSSFVTVNALFSTAAQASSISEPLAARLGVNKSKSIIVSGFDSTIQAVNLPSRHVDVECMDVVCTTGKTVIPKSTPVAFLIMPYPGNDMVLGMDWFNHLAARSGRRVLQDFAPDKGRLRFLPPGEAITTEEELSRFAHETQNNIDEGDFIAASWGRPDPGPCYDPSPFVCDMSHHVNPQRDGRAMLDAIRDAK